MIINYKSSTFISIALILLGLVACNSPKTTDQNEIAQSAQPLDTSKILVLGDISDNPRKKIRKFQPLANYLAANLNQFDYGRVKIAPDMKTMIAWLKSGEVDIYIDSPYPAMLAIKGADAKPILRRWKHGSAEYYSLIFTMSDRHINSLSDLKGKNVAFDHPVSTTGYMLPLAKLLESGLNPREIKSANDSVSEDVVGYIFSNEDENSIQWLLSNKVAAAAVDNQAFEKIPTEIKQNAIVLAETEKIARNLVVVRGDLPSDQINSISSILLDMNNTPEGRAILEKFSQTTKFDQFPTAASLNQIQDIYQQAQN